MLARNRIQSVQISRTRKSVWWWCCVVLDGDSGLVARKLLKIRCATNCEFDLSMWVDRVYLSKLALHFGIVHYQFGDIDAWIAERNTNLEFNGLVLFSRHFNAKWWFLSIQFPLFQFHSVYLSPINQPTAESRISTTYILIINWMLNYDQFNRISKHKLFLIVSIEFTSLTIWNQSER